MSHIVSLKYYSNRTILLVMLVILGLVSSRALISISTGLLAVNLLLSYKEHEWHFFSSKKIAALVPALIFTGTILFLFFSPDFKTGLNQLYYRLPWLVIPVSVAAIKKLDTQLIQIVLAYFVFILTVSGLIVLGNYLLHYEFYNEQLRLAKNIPTPLNHIRYSLMLAFGGVSSLYFAIRNNTYLSSWYRTFFTITGLFLIILLHILSVRSGILCFYLSIGAMVVYLAVIYGKWWIIPVGTILLFFILAIGYFSLPSLQNKISYMRYDIQQIQTGDIGHNSDGRRWRSLLLAKDLIREKALSGYGIGQVEAASKTFYQAHYPQVEEHNQKVPHNQFLYSGVEMGIMGILFILSLFIAPLLFVNWKDYPLFVFLSVIVIISCLVENTMESQIGMSFYLIFSSLLLNESRDE